MFEELDDLLQELKASCKSNIEESNEKPFEKLIDICIENNFNIEPLFSKNSINVLQRSDSDGVYELLSPKTCSRSSPKFLKTAVKSSHAPNYDVCASSSGSIQSTCLNDAKSKSFDYIGVSHRINENSCALNSCCKDNKKKLLFLSKNTDIASPWKGNLSESFNRLDFERDNACEGTKKKSQTDKYDVSLKSVSDSEKNMEQFRSRRHSELTNVAAVDSFMVQLYIESKEHHFGPFPFEICPRMTLRLLKLKIENELDVSKSSQKWIIGNSLVLDDEIRLYDCNLSPNSALFLYIDSVHDYLFIKQKITDRFSSMKCNKISRANDIHKKKQSTSAYVANSQAPEVCDKRANCFPNTVLDPRIYLQPCDHLHKNGKAKLEATWFPMNYCSKQGSGNAKVVDPSLEASRNLKVMKHSTNSELKVKSFNMSMPRDLDINLYSSGLRRHSSPDQRGKNNFNLKEFLHSCQQSLSNKIERFSPVSLDCGSSLLNQNADRYENVSRRYESSSHRETPPPTFLISRLKMLQKAESVNRENSTSECAKSETHYENSILKRLHYKLNFKKTSEIEIPVFEPDQVLTHEDPSEYNLNFADEHFGAPEISHDDIKNTAVGLNNMLGVDDVCIATDSKDSNSNENSMALESLNNLNLSDSELEIDGSFIHSDDKVRLESNDQRCVVPNEDYYGQESIQNDSHCAVNVNKHDSLISRHQENQVEVHIEDSVEILEEPSKSTENYEFLLKVENLDIVENISNFNCPICLGDFESGEGVVLHECLHTFCRECLINAIEFTQDALIKCPYRDRKYSCENHLQQREIKALLTLDAYEKYLRRSIKAAESLADNSFHCLTPDCPGWCMFESSINIFHCPVCYHFNCLNCCAIHEGLNCRQYQEKLKKLQKVDHDSEKTLAFLNKMIEDGKAVKCPKCDLILMKKWGCDWLKCSICTTEICWITRGPRWGPAGRGDISGGCKCGVNGVKCHPSCTYCH